MPHRPWPEQLLAALLESAEDAILSFALDGTIESWSRGAERLYGYSAEEIVGQPMARLLPLNEVPGLEALLVSSKYTKIVPCVIAERLQKNGTRLCVEVKRTTLLDEAGTTGGILETAKVMSRLGECTPEATQFSPVDGTAARHGVDHGPEFANHFDLGSKTRNVPHPAGKFDRENHF